MTKATRLAALAVTLNHPRRLTALYLQHARAARVAMALDRHPGRPWWRRQHDDDMRKVQALR